MPQLPSGRHIGVSYARLLQWAESATFGALSEVMLALQSPDDLRAVLDLLEYADADHPPSSEDPAAGRPFLSAVRVADLQTPACPWSNADQAALIEWLRGPRMTQLLEQAHGDLAAILSTRPVPGALRGVFDDDG